jgi:hypothetical protein
VLLHEDGHALAAQEYGLATRAAGTGLLFRR